MELANIFPSKYLKAHDLQGREPTVIIERADVESIGDDRKLVLYFQGKEKGLVTNRTNADRIAYAYGTNTDGWLGQSITLYTDLVPFQGKTVEAIRVKTPQKRAAPSVAAGVYRQNPNITTGPQREAAPPDDMSDEIPF